MMKPFGLLVFSIAAITLLSSCNGEQQTSEVSVNPEPGQIDNSEIVNYLSKKSATRDVMVNAFISNQRVDELIEHFGGKEAAEAMVEDPPADKMELMFMFATENLNAGNTHYALRIYENLEKKLIAAGLDDFSNPHYEMLIRKKAVSYLRLGEQENCISGHHGQSCIIPIKPGGIHHKAKGSREAVKLYTYILEQRPNDPQAIWLLNLAYMTLGVYPDSVPEQYFLDFYEYESGIDFPWFDDVAPELGVDYLGMAGGAAIEDINGDGHLDIISSDYDLRYGELKIFINDGNGGFNDKSKEFGVEGINGALNIALTDFNNDGYIDIYMMRGAWLESDGEMTNNLLMNIDGQGFKDVTKEMGLFYEAPSNAGSWADFNNDGYLDLFVGAETRGEKKYPCKLYINKEGKSFEDQSVSALGGILDFVKGASVGDYNNDSWMDIFISTYGTDNILLKNQGISESTGKISFYLETATANVAEPKYSMACMSFDFDNDGDLDLFVDNYQFNDVNITEEYTDHKVGQIPRMYKNNGDGTFEDVTEATQLKRNVMAMGYNCFDVDNDGYKDMYFGTGNPGFESLFPNLMFKNIYGMSFEDVTVNGGFGHIQKGHGIATGDVNGDGYPEIYVNAGGFFEGDVYQNVLFKNPGEFENNWIKIKLKGTTSNRFGVGSQIKVTVYENGKERDIYHTVSQGGNFGANPISVSCIGLGKAVGIKRIEVYWPASGMRTTLSQGLKVNTQLEIEETSD